MTISLVLGYGVFLDNDEIYKKYLDECLKIIQANPSEFVITSGGNVSHLHPYYSEAESVANYLVTQNRSLELKTTLEENSYSISQKIHNCRDLVANFDFKPSKLNVICDSLDIPKVFLITQMRFNTILGNGFNESDIYLGLMNAFKSVNDLSVPVKVEFGKCAFYGLPRNHSKADIYNEIIESILEISFDKYPELENIYSSMRKKALRQEKTKV